MHVGITAVCLAAEHNRHEVLDILLQFEADVNKPRNDGVTPLWQSSNKV